MNYIQKYHNPTTSILSDCMYVESVCSLITLHHLLFRAALNVSFCCFHIFLYPFFSTRHIMTVFKLNFNWLDLFLFSACLPYVLNSLCIECLLMCAWLGRHQLSVCQLTLSRFSCFLCVYVCVVACAISRIRLDRPENDISAITLMVTAQYCMSSAKMVCVCVCVHVYIYTLPAS